MNQAAKNFMPIGTVVQLKNSDGLVIIAGYLAKTGGEEIFDYEGFPYPLGYADEKHLYCFNEDQVEKVFAYGYRDYQFDAFEDLLKRAYAYYQETSREDDENV